MDKERMDAERAYKDMVADKVITYCRYFRRFVFVAIFISIIAFGIHPLFGFNILRTVLGTIGVCITLIILVTASFPKSDEPND